MIERFLSTYKDGFEVMLNPRERDEIVEEIERLNNIINRIKSIYQSLCFSAPENDYVFIEQLGEVLQELKGSDKE